MAFALLSLLSTPQLRADDLRSPRANPVASATQTGMRQNSASPVGLVGYWPFDETSGTIAHDASGNANNGTLACNGCSILPNWAAGMRNGALNFSGPNDLASVPDSASLHVTNNFTIAFWLKKAAGASNLTYLSKGAFNNGFMVATGNPGTYIYINLFSNNVGTARCIDNGVILDQTWEHIAVTYNGTTIQFYINGAPSVSCSATVPVGVSSSPLSIGGVNGSSPTGTMDEVRIYNRALSAQEVVAVYNDPGAAPVSVTPTNAVLTSGQTQQFSLTGTVNSGVSWTISPATGSVSSTGLYTAPGSVASAQSVTVTATNTATNTIVATAAVSLQPSQALGTFQMSELFGVSWPDQPIEFRYDGGQPAAGTARIMLSNGTSTSEVPFQWVSSCSDATATKGCIAVRSALPANANYTWTLQSGSPTVSPVNPVQLAKVGSNYEITNGLAGVRIVTPASNPAPFNLAPIQGIRVPGGTWTGAGSSANLLYAEPATRPGCIGCSLTTPMYTATGYTVTVVDSGPMKTVIQATYTFNKPEYLIGLIPLANAGSGHYTITVTMYANSKSVLFDEDTDMQFAYYLPLYAQLAPDTARFRGHDSIGPSGNPAISGNNNPSCGYESAAAVTNVVAASPIVLTSPANLANGQPVLISGIQGITAANGTWFAKRTGYPAGQFGLYSDSALAKPVSGAGTWGGGGVVKPAYRGQNLNPDSDGFLDLTYTLDRPTSYMCADPSFVTPSYMGLLADYPAAVHAAGWYDEFYRSGAGVNAPVVGFYTGRASKQVHSSYVALPGIYTSNRHWITGQQAAGIQVNTLLRGPSGVTATLVHRNWGIFVSTQADLLAPGLHQPIADEQNSLTGINLSRLYTYQLLYPDPPGGPQWEYLSANSANKLISLVRNGTSVCGSVTCYYTLLKNSEGSPWGAALLNMWQGNSAAAVQAALNGALQLAQKIVQTLASGDNHYDGPLGYYQLGLSTSPETAVLNAILMDSNSTPQQKTLAKACLALFGSLFWDDDWFPIDNYTGDGGGLANQVEQYIQYRTQAVAAAPGQPFLSSMTATAATYPANDFMSYFSPTGAGAGSTHYQSAFFEPLILNYLNFSVDGTTALNGYQPPMADPKWAAYANWELSIQTPPEPRFGGSTNPALGLPLRKGYSNGDGNTEADVRTGMLGTALYPENPTLAGNLMWAWQASNSATTVTEDAQFVTTLAVIDPTIPAIKPQLGSTNIPGYHSVERYNFGTANETALWFINGDFYSPGGHRHFDDGQVSIYAHAAPLAIDWNADLYYPSTAGRFMHNSIVYDAELQHLWSADNSGLQDVNTLMNNATNTEFAAFTNSTTSTGTFMYAQDGSVWTRTVRTMNFDPGYPIIYVTDSFAGASANTGKTLTWNLMATGPVHTPAGPITPTPRFSAGCEAVASQLPSTGTVSLLSAGLNQFTFTGFTWPKHATQGINWDLFILSGDATQQFLIGNWGHGCHTMREAGEYQNANGSPFQEVQDILRVHDTGSFATIILPYQKTQPPSRTVSQQGCGTNIVQGSETTCFNNSAATFSNGTTGVLTVYDSSSQTAFGVTASGGPQEVVVQPSQIVWTVGGATPGNRTVTLPGTWFPKTPIGGSGSTFTYSYPGGAQTATVSIVFTQTP
jgi:hypothetical protein